MQVDSSCMRGEMPQLGPLKLDVTIETWPFVSPFRISGYTFEVAELPVVRLSMDGCTGRGETFGVYYKPENAISIKAQVESCRATIEGGLSRRMLLDMLPPGGARNALDCAMWDLEAKISGKPAWASAGLSEPHALLTTFTCSVDTPEAMAARAQSYTGARAIKVKLLGDEIDAARIAAIRAARPDVWLGVDANQGFSQDSLENLMPALVNANVSLIEQPFAVGQERHLDQFRSPIPIAADESVQSFSDIPLLLGRFDVINIKLDKCGGLTEALAMARASRAMGLTPMVGNMFGTSLGMAPAFLVGQLCDVVDLDGPTFLADDHPLTVEYKHGHISCPAALWGT